MIITEPYIYIDHVTNLEVDDVVVLDPITGPVRVKALKKIHFDGEGGLAFDIELATPNGESRRFVRGAWEQVLRYRRGFRQ